MSELDNTPLHKYKVDDTFDFDGIVKIVGTCGYNPVKKECMYNVKMQDGRICEVEESWIDGGIEHFDLDENGRVKGKEYAVSFIASAPDELKVGDRVEVVDATDEYEKRFLHRQGRVSNPTTPDGSNPYPDKVWVDFNGEQIFYFCPSALRKLTDTLSFQEESDNVKAFKAILNEMAETYKAKDATYGNAYQDGFNRFGAVQLVSRMYEKYCRIENLLVRNADNKVPDESVIDTITDLGVQCVVLRMLLQKNDFENVE